MALFWSISARIGNFWVFVKALVFDSEKQKLLALLKTTTMSLNV